MLCHHVDMKNYIIIEVISSDPYLDSASFKRCKVCFFVKNEKSLLSQFDLHSCLDYCISGLTAFSHLFDAVLKKIIKSLHLVDILYVLAWNLCNRYIPITIFILQGHNPLEISLKVVSAMLLFVDEILNRLIYLQRLLHRILECKK